MTFEPFQRGFAMAALCKSIAAYLGIVSNADSMFDAGASRRVLVASDA